MSRATRALALLGTALLPPTLLAATAAAPAAAAAVPGTSSTTVVRGDDWFSRTGLASGRYRTFGMGTPLDTPVIGDWDGDGAKTPGVFRNGYWLLRDRLAGPLDHVVPFGRPGDQPVVGDWDGDGDDDIGVVRANTWLLDIGLDGRHAERRFAYGRPTDIPVAGDWDGTADGSPADEAGVRRGNEFLLEDETVPDGHASHRFAYGRADDTVVVGRWRPGAGPDGVGVVRGDRWFLRSALSTGPADLVYHAGRDEDWKMTGGRSGSSVAQPEVTYTVEIGRKGPTTADLSTFARTAREALGDQRAWTLGRDIRFVLVPPREDADIRLWLATPASVAAASPGCSAQWSCRVGDDVYINEERWQDATDSWRARSLYDYRRYVVLHEVGHWLGLGHRDCPGPGRPAPVMQQQSISLRGCESNLFPLPAEKADVARLHLD